MQPGAEFVKRILVDLDPDAFDDPAEAAFELEGLMQSISTATFPYRYETKNGWHVVCKLTFDPTRLGEEFARHIHRNPIGLVGY